MHSPPASEPVLGAKHAVITSGQDIATRRAYLLFALIPALLAVWALVGWVTGNALLKQFLDGRPSLSVMTALCLLIASASACCIRRRWPQAWTLGAAQLVAGLIIVASHVLRPEGHSWVQSEAWSSLFTGWMFTVSGSAAILLCLGKVVPGQIAAGALLLFSLLIGIGHFSTSTRLYEFLPGKGVAIPTVTAFASLAMSMLLACPHHGIVSALSPSKMVSRPGRMLLAAGMLGVAVATGLLLWAVQVAALDAHSALLILGWSCAAILVLTMWALVVAADRAESATRRVQADHDLQQRVINAAISHDLRSPLQTASIAARLLRAYSTDPRAARPLEQLERSHRRLDRLLRSMLDNFALAGGRRMQLTPCVFGLRELVLEVISENPASLHSRVIVTGDAQGWWDKEAIFRVVENLLLNACKYGLPDAPIRCRIRSEGTAEAHLEVENLGNPIPTDEWESIFEAFARGSGDPASNAQGWGVGLAFSRLVAEEHGGTLRVLSSTGQITIFELVLPRRLPETW